MVVLAGGTGWDRGLGMDCHFTPFRQLCICMGYSQNEGFEKRWNIFRNSLAKPRSFHFTAQVQSFTELRSHSWAWHSQKKKNYSTIFTKENVGPDLLSFALQVKHWGQERVWTCRLSQGSLTQTGDTLDSSSLHTWLVLRKWGQWALLLSTIHQETLLHWLVGM